MRPGTRSAGGWLPEAADRGVEAKRRRSRRSVHEGDTLRSRAWSAAMVREYITSQTATVTPSDVHVDLAVTANLPEFEEQLADGGKAPIS